MFQTGDTVVYFPRGVFKIDSVAPDERTGEICYRLTPVYGDGCSVCLPESSPVLKERIRKTLSSDEAEYLIKRALSVEPDWIEDEKVRTEYLRKTLSSGDRTELLGALRMIYRKRAELKQKKRKLHSTDEKFFLEADALIRDDFAFALSLRPEEVTEYIASKE